MKNNIVFDFNNVPASWALCFNDNCPLATQCLRRYAASQMPDNKTRVVTVAPQAGADGHCPWYVSTEPVRVAYGFSQLYRHVLYHDYAPMKRAITTLLRGHSNYYRYNNGELTLSPDEQQRIADIMADMGYHEPPVFDHYRYELRFR